MFFIYPTQLDISFNPFQPSVAFHIETSHLFCSGKQMTDFYIKRNNGLKLIKMLIMCLHCKSYALPQRKKSLERIWKQDLLFC